MPKLAVIPVRLGATRLPGKPLADVGGTTVVERVYRRTVDSGVFDAVVIATPDPEIERAAKTFDAHVELTSHEHRTGTDRVAEVAARNGSFDTVANVQGDLPFVTAEMLSVLVDLDSGGTEPDMATIGTPLLAEGYADPNTVKVVLDEGSNALYFSRSAIPHGLGAEDIAVAPVRHHLGLYAFRSEALRRFTSLPPTPLEQLERLEQLRMLEHGFRIRVGKVETPAPIEINTATDLAAARALSAGEAHQS